MARLLTRAKIPNLSWSFLLLLLILGVALGLRLHGLNWDSGYGFHPDERSLYMRADCMYDVLTNGPGYPNCVSEYPETEPGLPGIGTFLDADRSPLNPHWFPLGSILIYVLVFIRFILELFGDFNAFDLRYVGRTLAALADVGSVFLLYRLGRRMYGPGVGLLAAALTALAVIHIQNSHFYRPETFSVLLTLASFWAMFRMMEGRRWRDSLLLGLMVGLAMAPKVSVLPMVLPLLLAYGYRTWDAARAGGSGITPKIAGQSVRHAALAGGASLAVFFALTPYALLDFFSFIGDLAAQANMARHAGLWPFTVQYIDTPAFTYQFHQTAVWGLGLPLGLAAWGGILFAAIVAWRRKETSRADLLLLAWVVPSMLFLESFEVRFQRYFFPLMPFMILMGARLLLAPVGYFKPSLGLPSGIDSRGGWRSVLGRWWSSPVNRRYLYGGSVALVALVVFATGFYALAFQRVYANDHSAVAASRWIKDNIPAGTEFVSDNHWDEFVPDLYRSRLWQFPVYEPDDFKKMETLAEHLASAEYLVFYSYRPFVSVARAPERFPLSSSYYQELFRGNLGYKLDRSFTSYPELAGVAFIDDPYGRAGLPRPEPLTVEDRPPISINLGYADDNVVGYDHPQVLLFRNVDRLSETELLLRLSSRVAQQSRPPVGLLLSDEDKAAQREGGTWSQIIDRESWTNRLPVLAWLLAVELIYLVTLPLALFVFRPLPDRGMILARILGLLGVGYVIWLAVSLGWLDFNRGAILLGLLAVGSLSATVLLLQWREIKTFLSQRWRLLLTGEVLFLLAFLAFAAIRAANPDLWHPYRGGEKPMELAYLNAVVRSTTLPPYDPWFAGGYLNYYYWGYWVVSLPLKLTRILPTTAFNLAVPLFFALTVTGAYSVVYNLTEGVRRSRRRAVSSIGGGTSSLESGEPGPRWSRTLGSPVAAGLLAGLFTAVIGNLDGMVQMVQRGWGRVAHPEQGIAAFDFWRSSRMLPPLDNFQPSPLAFWVPEKVAESPDVSWHITEFPFFTFLFADLHAHMMVIPFTLLVIGLGLSLVAGFRQGGKLWTGAALLTLSLALGALWVINSWDYPSYLALVAALVVLAVYFRAGTWRGALLWGAPLLGLVTAVSILAFLPFHQVYETFDAGIAASKWRTPFDRYWAINGLFLFIIITYLIFYLRGPLSQILGSFIGWVRHNRAPDSPKYTWQLLYLGLGALAVVYFAVAGYWTGAFLLVLLTLTGLAAWQLLASTDAERRPDRAYAAVPLLLLGMGLGIGLGVDLVRLEGDIGRMNTMFKYYLEAWVLFSLVAAYLLWRLVEDGWLRRWNWGKLAWVAMLALLLGSSLIYTGLGTKARVADRFNDTPATLSGTAFMGQAVHFEQDQPLVLDWDREAIAWLQDNVQGSPVVLEAHNDQYHWGSRIANYTGLPTVLGWPWHQFQQRAPYRREISDRADAVREIYNTGDLGRAEDLLRRYEVKYVVVGELERIYYAAPGLRKFERLVESGRAKLVFRNEGVTIYEMAR